MNLTPVCPSPPMRWRARRLVPQCRRRRQKQASSQMKVSRATVPLWWKEAVALRRCCLHDQGHQGLRRGPGFEPEPHARLTLREQQATKEEHHALDLGHAGMCKFPKDSEMITMLLWFKIETREGEGNGTSSNEQICMLSLAAPAAQTSLNKAST